MAEFNLISLLVQFGLLGFTLAGYCPEVTVIEELDLQKLVGTWWVWDFNGMISYTEPHKCHVSHFYSMPSGKSLSVTNDYVYWTYKPNHVRYSWTIDDEDPAPNGNLTVTLKLARMGSKKVPFLVLDTDYTRYLVVHMCKDAPHFLGKMKSSLTFLRKLDYTEEELTDINTKVEAALKKSSLTRADLGLFPSERYTKNCVLPKFPMAVKEGSSIVVDAEALTATVNGLVTHASRACDDARALAADAANPNVDRRILAARIKQHLEDIKALSDDVKELSSIK